MNESQLFEGFDSQAESEGCSLLTAAPISEARVGQVADTQTDVPYIADATGLTYLKPTRDGFTPVRLTNFTACIQKEIIRDDGVEETRQFEIKAKINNREKVFSVPSFQFANMNWVTDHLGASAVISPGSALKDHARAAIQLLSGVPQQQHCFAHSGWRKIDGVWFYLHQGGAIGSGEIRRDIQVELSPPLDLFLLPEPPGGEQLKDAVRAWLSVLDLAPDNVTVPLLAALSRSVLGPTDFSVHLAGPSGSGKSELAAIIQQHFGAAFTAKNLPGSWSSTANALELLAFNAKDTILVVDDFAPAGSQQDVQRMNRDADRVFRAQGNRSGRQRARQDGSLRPVKSPRGLILSTGEDIPRTYSVRARVFIVEVGPEDMNWDELTPIQRMAAEGVLASSMAGFIQWMAGRYSEVKNSMQEEVRNLRAQAITSGGHKRTPEIVAHLAFGFNLFTQFALETGAINEELRNTLRTRAWTALGKVAEAQADHQSSAEPTQRFIELLRTAITSGQAHVASCEGGTPGNYNSWGWRERTTFRDDNASSSEIVPQGALVGWTDGIFLYLDVDAAYGAAQRVGSTHGESLGISARTLTKRIHERGLLVSVDETRRRLTIRKTLQGPRREVLHLKVETLMDIAKQGPFQQ